MRRGLFAKTRQTLSMSDVTGERPGTGTNSPNNLSSGEKRAVQALGLDPVVETSNTAETSSDLSGGQRQQPRRFSTGAECNIDQYDEAANPEERQRKGQCPSCGQQLYLVTSSRRWFTPFKKQSTRRKALSVPGMVNRGQCLKCVQSISNKPGGEVGTEQAPQAVTASHVAAAAHNGHTSSDSVSTFSAAINTSQGSVSSTTALYEGPHNSRGERHGKGTMRWANGDKYVGEFYEGTRQGSGTLNFADSSEYVGDWWNNYMHGSGTRRFVNGDIYVGDYRYSKREGSGRFYFTNGDLYYGNWKDDKMEGFGRYYYHSGQRFEGYFKDGRRNGKGKLQRTDGSLDLYRYEDDRRVGAGVRWSADRTKAWRLDLVRGSVRAKKITVAEAVSLVYQIEGAIEGQGDGTAEEFAQMLTLEDTVGA
mmetsp:Transcript_23521/g.44732  ORF Transcript_23521/g.44732 Transcript_23521/m.44732 type:complete len:421 (-) Transcript_23521:164-1426(-)